MRISSCALASIFFLLFNLSLSSISNAQNQSPVTYVSQEDQNMTIRSVIVAPVIDNMNNVYGLPLTEHLKKKIQAEQQWEVIELPSNLSSIATQLDSSAKNRQALKKATGTSALLTLKLIKGPKGISLWANLYAGPGLDPLLQESADQIQGFELESIKKNADLLFDRIKKNLPYQALVLSRRGDQVTINIGTQNGLGKAREARAILILKVNRHPKRGTMVSSEKEILAKIDLFKIDEYLSFGEIKFEKQPNILQAGTKVIVENSLPMSSEASGVAKSDPAADHLIYGEKPKEWVPMNPPQFGSIGMALGIVQYNQNYNLVSSGSITATNNFGPTIKFAGEMWLNDKWFLSLLLKQSAFAVANGLTDSTPSTLNMTLSQQMLSIGHNFLLTEDFFGPKIRISGGPTQFSVRADQSSPLALTSMSFGGLALGFAGSFPISETMPVELGAQFKYYWWPTTTENVASGDVTSTKINNFGFFGKYKRSQNFNYTLDFLTEYYATEFNASGATRTDPAVNISHKVTNLLVGIEYLF